MIPESKNQKFDLELYKEKDYEIIIDTSWGAGLQY